ncbi:hypothetical protein GGS23DRAFT_549274 [Durotheca rogersii]|uniref:uncharacterized protein n=1 Tax=Durotheca rogersii TaxID=419775 RepID=UPI00221E6117|nr:uncharacterized protein GGS23DRAFT_549274 [Durotheca rogersii]KAI5867638.1 hypothetical protein GGS23DRAFT_549274 [Durotheca rogersii]
MNFSPYKSSADSSLHMLRCPLAPEHSLGLLLLAMLVTAKPMLWVQYDHVSSSSVVKIPGYASRHTMALKAQTYPLKSSSSDT